MSRVRVPSVTPPPPYGPARSKDRAVAFAAESVAGAVPGAAVLRQEDLVAGPDVHDQGLPALAHAGLQHGVDGAVAGGVALPGAARRARGDRDRVGAGLDVGPHDPLAVGERRARVAGGAVGGRLVRTG